MTEQGSISAEQRPIGFDKPVFSNEDMKRNGDVLELRTDHRGLGSDYGFAYERKCLNEIASGRQDSITIGPVLTDYMLGLNKETISLVRPDAFKFKVENDVWTLEEMFEFKAGKRKGLKEVERKIDGFNDALSFFRENPKLLPDIIAKHLAGVVVIPEEINIPQNREITLTFYFSNKESMDSISKHGFPIQSKRIKR